MARRELTKEERRARRLAHSIKTYGPTVGREIAALHDEQDDLADRMIKSNRFMEIIYATGADSMEDAQEMLRKSCDAGELAELFEILSAYYEAHQSERARRLWRIEEDYRLRRAWDDD